MEKGIVCFSFDDGRKDNRKVAKILLSMDIPASFSITTGYVDGTCPEETTPTNKKPLSVDDICWINDQNIFEIALHGDQHLNTLKDIKTGKRKIETWIGRQENDRFGFASPGTGIDLNLLEKEKDFFTKEITYIRVSLRIKSWRMLRILSRKVARVIHSPLLYKIAYADTLMGMNEIDQLVYSVPVLSDITEQQLKALIDLCVGEKKVLVIMLHSIEEPDKIDDAWSWHMNKFMGICKYIYKLRRESKLDILTVQELYNKAHPLELDV